MVGGSFNVLFLGLGLTILLHPCVAREHGFIDLTSDVFDKIVSRHEVVLVKIDESLPYGEKHEEFVKVANMSMALQDLLVGEVRIHDSDYGEHSNQDLAERYNATNREDWPAYRLFLKGKKEPVVYTGSVNDADKIMKFVIDNAGIWLGFPGCLEHFDNLVTEFLHAKGDNRNAVIRKAEEAAKSLTEKEDKESADVYIKTMKTIKEKGDDFIKKEKKRVEQMKEGKLSEKKKEYLGKRFGILNSFNFRVKDEL